MHRRFPTNQFLSTIRCSESLTSSQKELVTSSFLRHLSAAIQVRGRIRRLQLHRSRSSCSTEQSKNIEAVINAYETKRIEIIKEKRWVFVDGALDRVHFSRRCRAAEKGNCERSVVEEGSDDKVAVPLGVEFTEGYVEVMRQRVPEGVGVWVEGVRKIVS